MIRLFSIVFVTASVISLRAQTITEQVSKTVNEGVYSTAQAARGQEIFQGRCTTCHDPARFIGSDFMSMWAGKPLNELFIVVSTTMPEDNPGSLKPQQYADIIGYFLELNEFPPGSAELSPSADSLSVIKIERRQ